MKIALIGATGFLGKFIATSALEKNINLKVLIRNKSKFGVNNKRVEQIQGDYFDKKSLEKLLKGVDALISTFANPVNFFSKRSKEQQTEFMQNKISMLPLENTISILNDYKIKRFINISATSIPFKNSNLEFKQKIMRNILKIITPDVVPYKEDELKTITRLNLNYTSIRSPIIKKNIKGNFSYDLTKQNGCFVDAKSLADFCIDILDKKELFKQAPFVATLK